MRSTPGNCNFNNFLQPLRIFLISWSICLFQPSLMFVGNYRRLTRKHKTRMENCNLALVSMLKVQEPYSFFYILYINYEFINVHTQSATTNGREPRSCLGRVFSCKFGSFTDNTKNVATCKWLLLKLKTQPRFCPVS